MMLATEKQRRKFVNEQIQKTAQENQGEVVVVVQEVLEEQATGKKQGAPQPQEKSTTPSPKTLPPGAAEVSA